MSFSGSAIGSVAPDSRRSNNRRSQNRSGVRHSRKAATRSRRDCPSYDIEEQLEPVIHMKLLVAVEERKAIHGRRHVHLNLSEALHQHNIL